MKKSKKETILGIIRWRLRMTLKEFSEILNIKEQNISAYSNGQCIVPVAIAKHILNVIKDFGIIMTLDEFYEEIKPYNIKTRSKNEIEGIPQGGRDRSYLIKRLREIDHEVRNGEGGN